MATTKAFELAQLSALTTVDASGNVTTSTSQIANASGDLTFDSAADIILNVDGGDLRLYDDTVQFGRIANDGTDLVIEAYTADRSLLFKGLDGATPITALSIDMSASGAATFLDQVTIGGNLIHAGNLTIDAGGDITLDAAGGDILFRDNGAHKASITMNNNVQLSAKGANEDILFRGVKGGTPDTVITALTLDMSNDGRATFNENVVIQGDLTVEGTSVTLNTTDLNVEDKNITLNYHATADTSASAGGAGITIQDAVDASNDASILWDDTNDKFTMSHGLTLLNATHLQFTRGGELRSTDTGGSIRTLVRVNGTNELEYGWSGAGPVKFMGGGSYAEKIRIHTDGNVGIGGVTTPVTALHVDPGYVTLGTSTGTDNSWINNVEDGNLELVNEGRSTNDGAVRINRKNNPAGDTTYFRDTVIYDGKSNVIVFVDGSEGKVGIGTDGPGTELHVTSAGHNTYNSTVTKGTNHTGLSIVQEGGNTDMTGVFFGSGGSGAGSHWSAITGSRTAHSLHWGTQLNFYTHANNTSNLADATQKMIITGDGNVGIGDLNPSALRLSVVTPTANHVGLQVENSNTSDSFGMVVKAGNDANDYIADFRQRDNTNIMRILGDGNVGIGTTDPNALLHISGTSPHMDVGPHGGNRAKFGYHNLDVIIGSSSSTGSIIFKNNIGSTDSPQTSGDTKVKIADVGMTIYSDTYNILDIATDTNDDQTSTDGIVKITNGASHTTKAEFRWDESEDLVHVSYGDHGRHISINSSGNVGIGTGSVSPVHTLDVDGAIATRQVRHSIRPTLNLDFANSKELDPRITFYRDSIATYYDSKGILRYANVNEPRFDHDPVTGESRGLLIEEARTNVMTKSAHMHTWPVLVNGNQVVEANAAVAPDGTFSAMKYTAITPPGSDTRQWLYQLTPSSANSYANKTVTGSFWARSDTNLSWQCHITDNVSGSSYNYSTTTEWQRFSFVKTCAASSPGVGLYPVFVGSETKSLYLWGGMIEEGGFATSDIPSDTRFTSRSSKATYYDENGTLVTAPKDGARYGYKYDGRKWVETGLILENAATKLITEMNKVGAGWAFEAGYLGQVFVRNTTETTAPDGSYTAVKCDVTALGTDMTYSDFLYQPGQSWAGTTKTLSFFVKGTAGETISAKIDGAGGGGSFIDHTLTGGWDRISATYSYPSGYSVNGVARIGPRGLSGASEGTARVWYVWGAQLEDSHSMSSYIYGAINTTRSADVYSSVTYTRPKDIAKINNILNEDWYNTKEGSIYVDFDPTSGAGSDAVVVGIGDGTIRGFRAPWLTGDTQIRAASWSGTAYSALHYYNSVTTTDQHKLGISFSYQDTTFTSSLDGSTAQQATSWAGVETDATTMWIGGETDTGRPYTGTIGKVSIYNESLSGAELQALTENN